jgi:hypothetical protein
MEYEHEIDEDKAMLTQRSVKERTRDIIARLLHLA